MSGAKIEKKLGIIGVISVLASVIFFFVSDVKVDSRGLMTSILDIFMASILIFIVLAINFLVLSFLVRKIRKHL